MASNKRKLTSFERGVPDYRRRILQALAKALFLPPLVSLAVLGLILGVPVNLLSVTIAAFSIPLTISARSYLSERAQDRAAKSLNATVIPRVKGKWPGNLDVALRIVKSFENDYVLQVFADIFREYDARTVNTRLFWHDQMITMDESVMKFVSATGFSHFEKGILWHERIDKLLGTGLFNAEGDLWKTGRAIARPFFARERISDFQIFERTATSALDLIAQRSRDVLPIDIQDLLSRFSLDSASEFLFGMKLGTLSQPLTVPGKVKLGPKGSIPIEKATKFDEFTEAFENVAVIITRRGTQGDTWPLLELFGDKTEDSIATIMNWMDPVVGRAVAEKEKRKSAGVDTAEKEDVFLDFLASKTDDVEHIRYELLTYLIASKDTTASLLTFIVYFFAMYPAVCDRLRHDILTTLGSEEPPTYDTLRNLKYLRAVINEALRLFPSAPLIARTSLNTPLVIPASQQQALYFPPKTQVMMVSLLTHRSHDLWGDDADEFRPERWLDSATTAKVNATPFMFCPFAGGPRICIGQEFALNEAGFFVVKLLQRFKSFRLAPQFQPPGSLPPAHWAGKPGRQGMEKIFPAINFTLHSKGGIWMYGDLDG
ncbi:cytochrome P450 monooxygenase CYP63 [Mycena belliarum]|uniref:Cytochrome P450 monooxygenase CYP63 n=1 Tax=Mycena belliarum TaxID=1033014 RepID=A0AAD6XJ32_9AGAR|nr:cytochrome P450 monooxygenase CYP63 [Mycena belliae]